jgi:hypothetical protein
LFLNFSANDPWNPVPQNGSGGLGSHPDSAFSALAVTSKFQNNNDPWSLGGAAPPKESGHIDPFSPNAQKQLQEFDLLREEIDMHQAPMIQANAGKTFRPCFFPKFLYESEIDKYNTKMSTKIK